MKEYDYDEINKMQQKALQRVQNMKITANRIVEDSEKEQDINRARDSFYNAVLSTPKPEHIKMPAEFPERQSFESFENFFEDKKEDKTDKKPTSQSENNMLKEIFDSPDRSLILALLMLLKADGADEDILMSLLYIML